MANPTASAAFNKSTYAPGELMTLTVTHADIDRAPLTVTIVVTDTTGGTGTATTTVQIDPGSVAVSSVPARTWTPGAATSSQSIFTATA